MLVKNSPLVEKFARGMLKGLWYVRDREKKEDAIRILAKWIKADLTYARDIFEISGEAWTRDGTASEREMKLSLDMSRQPLKTVRQELTPADMYDFVPVRKAKQELQAKGGHHRKQMRVVVQNVQVAQVVQNVQDTSGARLCYHWVSDVGAFMLE